MKLYAAPVGKGQVIHWFQKLQDMYHSYKKCSLGHYKEWQLILFTFHYKIKLVMNEILNMEQQNNQENNPKLPIKKPVWALENLFSPKWLLEIAGSQ